MPYDAIVVMGKTHAPGDEPHELRARAAFGALCWRQGRQDALFICCEGYDLPDKSRSGADIARQVALQAGIPQHCVVARPLVNCTAREVAAIRAVLHEHGRCWPLVITHPYHVRRTRRYLRAVGVSAHITGCSWARAQAMPDASHDLLALIARGEPRGQVRLYNAVSEWLLLLLHTLDPPGIIENRLADWQRGDRSSGVNAQQH